MKHWKWFGKSNFQIVNWDRLWLCYNSHNWTFGIENPRTNWFACYRIREREKERESKREGEGEGEGERERESERERERKREREKERESERVVCVLEGYCVRVFQRNNIVWEAEALFWRNVRSKLRFIIFRSALSVATSLVYLFDNDSMIFLQTLGLY